MLLAVGILLGFVAARSHPPADPAAVDAADSVAGPWGELLVTPIAIERPGDFISVNRVGMRTNEWRFDNYTAGQLRGLFSKPDLTPDQQRVLLDEARWQMDTNGIIVVPGTELILGLSPEARARLYAVLSTTTHNYYQRFPFAIQAERIDEWFAANGLSPETEKLIRSLLYRSGNALCFADILEALSRIASPEEKRLVAKMFSRQATLLVKLRIQEGQDVEPLVAYWGKMGQAKDIRPLLESLARRPGGATLDISHLLTPFARQRLYTYPFPTEDPVARQQDCFWTTMNFFNAEPEDRFTRFEEVRRVIQKDYYPVQGDPTYGDVVWFVDEKGTAIHSAVYLAGDFFFTKNGANSNEPWTLMSLEDLLATYNIYAPLRLVAYRYRRS